MTKSGNLFDPIRHLAALTVLYSHHFALSGLPEPSVPRWETYGFVAVVVFFAISGFLMPTSFESSRNFLDFMARRCRRIFPGLIICSFLMIYGLGAALTPDSLVHYLFGKPQLSNFMSFATFGGRPIDGVFSDYIFKHAINGSLWSLPVEFAWYVIIGYALSVSQSWKTPAALLWLSGTAVLINQSLKFDYAFFNVPFSFLGLFGVAFSTGALLSVTREAWTPYRVHLAAIAVIVLLVDRGRPDCQILGTASIAILTVIAAISFRDPVIRGRFDFSYGIYIYAFPIQQLVINRVTGNFWFGMALSVVLTVIAGAASYYLVERRFLHRRMEKLAVEPPACCGGGPPLGVTAG